MSEEQMIIKNNLKMVQKLLDDCSTMTKAIEEKKERLVDAMICPKCSGDTKVIESRYRDIYHDGSYIKYRRRICLKCGFKYKTIETLLEEEK